MAASLETLAARRDELTEQLSAVDLAREIRYLESLLIGDTMSQLAEAIPNSPILTQAAINDEIGFGGRSHAGRPHISKADDYFEGRYRPFIENEQDIQVARGIGRYIAGADEMAKCILKNLRNYIVGPGGTVAVTPRKGKGGEAYIAALQEFVDEFCDLNDIQGESESQLLLQSITDGEVLAWLKPNGPAAPRLRFVGGEHLTQPPDIAAIEDHYGLCGLLWSFGVASDHDDYEQVHGYFVDWYGQGGERWEFIKAAESVFVKRNVPQVCKRGLTDFFSPYSRMALGSKLADYIARGAIIQASIAGIRKVPPSATNATVQNALAAKLTSSSVSAATTDGRNVTVMGEDILGGRLVTTSNDYMHGPMGTPQGPLFVQVYQMLARLSATCWAMPEYMVSSDASNANYSSTLVAGAPFVNNVKHEQRRLAKAEEELLWKAISMAAECGRFGGVTAQQLYQCCEVKVEFESPETVDQAQQEQVFDSQQAAGVLSAKTRASKSGLDYEQELANGAAPMGGLGSSSLIADQPDSQTVTDDQMANTATADRLNGAQVTAAADILQQVALGTTADITALGLLVGIGISEPLAKAMVQASAAKAAEVQSMKAAELAKSPPVNAQAVAPRLEALAEHAIAKLFEK